MITLLWTDILIYFLLLLLIYACSRTAKDPISLQRWKAACATPLRASALVILVAYLFIGLLDSVHYRSLLTDQIGEKTYSFNVRSILDDILQPISDVQETSYSAPFATQLFTKNLVKNADGSFMWQRAKLTYTSSQGIINNILVGALIAGAIFASLSFILVLMGNRYQDGKWFLRKPWLCGYITLGLVLLFLCVSIRVSMHYHILGTDKIGTDIFYASLKSIRTGMVIGVLSTMIAMPFAVLLGAMAGYFRGWVDDLIQYIYITLSSVPGVLLIAAVMLSLDAYITRHSESFNLAVYRTDFKLFLLCAVLGLSGWTGMCRIVRAEVLKLRDQDFILAARVLGANGWQVIVKHIVPNLMHIIHLTFILDFSGLVLAEAVLSYIGVGVDPSMYSWGNMINAARTELARDPVIWWCLAGAFIFMFTLVLAANIVADGVKTVFDPRGS